LVRSKDHQQDNPSLIHEEKEKLVCDSTAWAF